MDDYTLVFGFLVVYVSYFIFKSMKFQKREEENRADYIRRTYIENGLPRQANEVKEEKKISTLRILIPSISAVFVLFLIVIKINDKFSSTRTTEDDFETYSKWRNADLIMFNGTGKKQNLGKFTFLLSDTMYVGEQYSIKAAIQKAISTNLIRKALIQEVVRSNIDTIEKNKKIADIKNLQIEKIKIGNHMKLTLIDPCPQDDKCFDIKPVSESEQIIEKNEATVWTWYVTPLKGGRNILVFQIEMPMQKFAKSIQVNENEVHVIEKVETKVETFWGNNWQYLLSSLGVVAAFFITNFFFKNRSSS